MDVSATTPSAEPPVVAGAELSALEVEAIDLFVAATRLLGVPRSIGEIYGLLFMAAEPMTFDQLVSRLRISKGSVSQGLKALRAFGAVRVSYVPGDRRDHYRAETDLKSLVSGFINGQVVPHLENGQGRLGRLRVLAEELGEGLAPEQRGRLEKLEYWHHRARTLAPLAGKLLDLP